MRYYKTARITATGKKFEQVRAHIEEAHNYMKALSKKYGFSRWYQNPMYAYGGLYAAEFDTPPDPALWRPKKTGEKWYVPRRNTVKGKALLAEIQAAPIVERSEANKVVGIEVDWGGISLTWAKRWYLFTVPGEWEFKRPVDCLEITYTQYQKLFNGRA